jgi:hypothetical protein
MGDHQVHFILDAAFGGDLWSLSRRAHVWICHSPQNDMHIRDVSARETESYSQLCGVRSFELGADPRATFYAFLGTLYSHHDGDLEHGPWDAIQVSGIDARDVSIERIVAELFGAEVVLEPLERGITIRRAPGER